VGSESPSLRFSPRSFLAGGGKRARHFPSRVDGGSPVVDTHGQTAVQRKTN